MSLEYPRSFEKIRGWARKNNVSEQEGRVRFAQYAILRAIASSRSLQPALVFKGGNALDFIWQPNRSTTDLDFSFDSVATGQAFDANVLTSALTTALATAGTALNVALRIQSIRPNPPRADKTFVTYEIKIGYALQDDTRNVQRIRNGESVSAVIEVEISLNEVIGAAVDVDIGAQRRLRVSTIEDIVAEKLRALLQQPIRNRNRSQDLLDIAVYIQQRGLGGIDRKKVSQFLLAKAHARNVSVSRAAFAGTEVRERARQDYDALKSTTRLLFIPFDEAVLLLDSLLQQLDIPAGSS